MNYHQSNQESFYDNSMSPTTVQSVTILAGPTAAELLNPAGQRLLHRTDGSAGYELPAQCDLRAIVQSWSQERDVGLVDDASTVDVPVSGTEATGTITVDQSSLDFGSQIVNQNSDQQNVVSPPGTTSA